MSHLYAPNTLPRWSGALGTWLLHGLLVGIGVLMLVPFYWVLVTALLPPERAFALPPHWLVTTPTLMNFQRVFELVPFPRLVLNSLKIASIVTVGSLVTSLLAAYAFARIQFPGRTVLFVLLLSALMVPQQVTVIPTFILMRNLRLLDTHEALYLPGLISVFGIFLLRQFLLTIPRDLEDAAKIDGAGHAGILLHVITPLTASPLSALAIFTFQQYWNDFFWPNIFLSSLEKMTVPVGLTALQGAFNSGPSGAIFAAISMILVPLLIVFVVAQRAITEGIAMTGIKG